MASPSTSPEYRRDYKARYDAKKREQKQAAQRKAFDIARLQSRIRSLLIRRDLLCKNTVEYDGAEMDKILNEQAISDARATLKELEAA